MGNHHPYAGPIDCADTTVTTGTTDGTRSIATPGARCDPTRALTAAWASSLWHDLSAHSSHAHRRLSRGRRDSGATRSVDPPRRDQRPPRPCLTTRSTLSADRTHTTITGTAQVPGRAPLSSSHRSSPPLRRSTCPVSHLRSPSVARVAPQVRSSAAPAVAATRRVEIR